MLYQLQGPGHHTCTRSLESRVPAKFNFINFTNIWYVAWGK